MSLLPMPWLATHSFTAFLMNSILRRKSLAAGMPCSSGRISGRRRVGLLALRVIDRDALEATPKLSSVCTG